MNILDLIARENKLRAMCAEVYGPENANWHTQRLTSRYEKDYREIAGTLVLMRSVK